MMVRGLCNTTTTLDIPDKMTWTTIMKLTRNTLLGNITMNMSVWYKNHCENIKKDVVVRVNNFEWDSDNDDILDTANPNEGECHGYLSILGFHPYKEVIFLNQKRERGLAYHFNSSKVQNLGSTFPKPYDDLYIQGMYSSFIYTPCWI